MANPIVQQVLNKIHLTFLQISIHFLRISSSNQFLFLFLQILEKQVLNVAKAMEEKIDDEIAALDRLDTDDIEVLRERRLQQMKRMAEKRSHWISLGHGDYSEIPSEKEFFSIVKASERVVCHFYRENWPCKV